ncbi:gluconokinase [Muriicola marianensis]|uniref:Gluconokinase n=1 Tax=Muriicola marianensis TaxID=1324801 RepID=A0ABQ1QPZ8_9FLAO|nr:gluconokinase [Muriicola marianensis]GGD37357.1 gluconokinase [Muriicola marianensis]
MMDKTKRIFFVMGVSGSGKSTIGKQLANTLSLPFFDGDDFHPQANITKMSEGLALDDEDRKPWLQILNSLAKKHEQTGAVIVCSALKESYRNLLEKGISPEPLWIYLNGSFDLISERLRQRKGHFMPSALLRSQFDTLEAPEDAIEVSVKLSPDQILETILKELRE